MPLLERPQCKSDSKTNTGGYKVRPSIYYKALLAELKFCWQGFECIYAHSSSVASDVSFVPTEFHHICQVAYKRQLPPDSQHKANVGTPTYSASCLAPWAPGAFPCSTLPAQLLNGATTSTWLDWGLCMSPYSLAALSPYGLYVCACDQIH